MTRRWFIRGVLLVWLGLCLGGWACSYRYSACLMTYNLRSFTYPALFLERGKLYVCWIHAALPRRQWDPGVERLDPYAPYASYGISDSAGTHFLGFAGGSSTIHFPSTGGLVLLDTRFTPSPVSRGSGAFPIMGGRSELPWGPWEIWSFAAIPFWFPIALYALMVAFAWRKTRPPLPPETAFPVELSPSPAPPRAGAKGRPT